MKSLETQEQFEALWFDKTNPNSRWIVYYTAEWCKACKALDHESITKAAADRNISIFICDETINEYTVGYCRISSFPTFQYYGPRTVISTAKTNNTADVIEWINNLPTA
jgi:hypothetical protein